MEEKFLVQIRQGSSQHRQVTKMRLLPKACAHAVALSTVFITNAVGAAPEWNGTHFGSCFSEDVVMQADGSWWWFEQGLGIRDPLKYGGSYITSRRTISARDYGSLLSGNFDATGISLRNKDGTWVDTFYLQISDASMICGEP